MYEFVNVTIKDWDNPLVDLISEYLWEETEDITSIL
jgi:hypothetical protein